MQESRSLVSTSSHSLVSFHTRNERSRNMKSSKIVSQLSKGLSMNEYHTKGQSLQLSFINQFYHPRINEYKAYAEDI